MHGFGVRVGSLVLWLSACGGATAPARAPAPCPAQNVTVSLLASPDVNPADDGQARPVVVRVFQLKSDARLLNASFDSIWHDEKTVLGEDLVKVDEVQVYPGTRQDVKFDRNPQVAHVAAVALFSNPQGRSWMMSVDLAPVPEPGKCAPEACSEGDDECTLAAVRAPRLSFWIDKSKVDDGVEHLEDFPSASGPMRAQRQ